MYGPCDPRWGSWFDVPEWALAPYQRMLPRLLAEQTQSQMNGLMASNGHQLSEQDRVAFLNGLRDSASPSGIAARRPRVRVTPAFARDIQATAHRADPNAGEEVKSS